MPAFFSHRVIPALLPLLLLLPGCGGNGDGGGELQRLLIEATGSANRTQFQIPKTIQGGLVELRFTNSSKNEQEAQLIRVVGNHSVDEVLDVIAGDGKGIPSWLRGAGGVGLVKPGDTGSSVQVLQEGRYYVIGDSDEGKPPTGSLTVEGGDSDAELPDTTARIESREYTFTATGLRAGRNRVLFDNIGAEPHHVVAEPLLPGKTIADVRKFIREESGRPPVDFESAVSTSVVDERTKLVADLTLKRGRYALLCFITDRKGGPPHVAKGMIAEANVR